MTDEEFVQNISGLNETGDITARNEAIKRGGGMDRLIALALRGVARAKNAAGPKSPPTFIADNYPDTAALERAIKWWGEQRRPDLVAAIEQQAAEFRHRYIDAKQSSWGGTWKTWYMNAVHFTKPPRNGALFVAPVLFEQTTIEGWVSRLEIFHGLHDDCPGGHWLKDKWGAAPGEKDARIPPDAWSRFRAKWPKAVAVAK